jgi:hypothetical protein
VAAQCARRRSPNRLRRHDFVWASGEASSSFLKKRTKKLLNVGARIGSNAHPNGQKFLLLFPKRSAFFSST